MTSKQVMTYIYKYGDAHGHYLKIIEAEFGILLEKKGSVQ